MLYWNLLHHLESGIDVIAVADNKSGDDTRDVVREFGDSIRYRSFSNFGTRQTVRLEMLHALLEETSGKLDWAAISDTDEFFWSTIGLAERLNVPDDIVAVNFDAKLFLPTAVDPAGGPVFVRETYHTGRTDTPLHTSYREGKTFYRASWLKTLPLKHHCKTHEHECQLVPHPQYRPDEACTHHYMIQDEDQFVAKAIRLIDYVMHRYNAPTTLSARVRWNLTPRKRRKLNRQSAQFKKDWWGTYLRGGEPALREYYRTVYTIPKDKLAEYLADGSIVHDDSFARYATRYLDRARAK
jgi:hypothetical protein